MRKYLIDKRRLDRRAFILGGLQLGLSSALIARLGYLQSVKADTYKTMAEENRINLQLIIPERGLIVDRNGVLLAENRPSHRLMMERQALSHKDKLVARLSQYLEIDGSVETLMEKQVRRTPHDQTILLKEHLSWEELSAIEFHAPSLPGIHMEEGTRRYYPLGKAASHLVGYVGTPSRTQASGNRLLKMPGMRVGKSGLERREELRLRGESGLRHMEINALGQYLRELDRRESSQGEQVQSTIHAELQRYATEKLHGKSGAIVVLDIERGDVLCMASHPAFDPNRFSTGISSRYWQTLIDNDKKPLLNKATAGQYPPGSTIKMLVGLEALNRRLITPDTHFFCPGYYYISNHRFNCWRGGGHGPVNFYDAITQSCDTYFYEVGHKLGMEGIAAIARMFGLGTTFDMELGSEKAGLIPTKAWKARTHGQDWRPGDTINASIGQGYMLATPMQLAVMTARLASGHQVTPRLVMEEPVPAFAELPISKAHLRLVQRAMYGVMNEKKGTGYDARIKKAHYHMAGKTGTSQVRRIRVHGIDQSSIPWEHRHHALFVAFAPYQKPRYAAAVVVEHGGSGSSVAAPLARDIMVKTQTLMEAT